MATAAPDERHEFTGWSVERFDDRHFLEWHALRSYGPPSGRVEISEVDFRSAVAGDIMAGKLIRKYDQYALSRGLEAPSTVLKVMLLTSLVIIAGALLALLAGWM